MHCFVGGLGLHRDVIRRFEDRGVLARPTGYVYQKER